nr:GNAT family N-acetyltransferase [Sinorhizobium meliloti]
MTELPELQSARLILRRPKSEDVAVRLQLGRHEQIVEAYGGTFDPEAPFTRDHAEAAIRFVEEQDYAWVIDAGRFIGHVRFHSLVKEDKRAALAIGIDDPEYLGRGYGAEAIKLALTYAFRAVYTAFPCACWRATFAQSPVIASAGSLRKGVSVKQPSSMAHGTTTSSWECWTESSASPDRLRCVEGRCSSHRENFSFC